MPKVIICYTERVNPKDVEDKENDLYKCDECEKEYVKEGMLLRHKKVHIASEILAGLMSTSWMMMVGCLNILSVKIIISNILNT